MAGLDRCRDFFTAYGLPMLQEEFADEMDHLCAGLVGAGSECFGFDDAISQDHDFFPRFCLWLSEEDEARIGFRLMRAYQRITKEVEGAAASSVVGCRNSGVQIIEDFYQAYTGRRGAPETWQDWLYTPSHYLAEATNGAVFFDGSGSFSDIRAQIKHGMPEDVRRKKIAAALAAMAQSGQYNFSRCHAHGEAGAAQIALYQFVQSGIQLIFLLNRAHAPYYKWSFRAMRALPLLSDTACELEALLLLAENAAQKQEKMERICAKIVTELQAQSLSARNDAYLESHAYAVTDGIRTPAIRMLHVMEGGN